ncbi:MAG: phosphomannomutase/phosphoglucomutase, partial [Lysobacteraceae bacterium]
MDEQIDEQRKHPIRAIKEALTRFRYVIAALLLVLAIAMVWDGWNQGAASRNAGALANEAQTVQSASEKIIDGLVRNFDRCRNNPLVIAAAASGDTQDAAKAFASDWPEAAKVTFIAPNLKEAFADPKAFGYGRIAALDAGLNSGSATVTVARVDGHPQLLLTGPIKQSGEVVTLAMLPLPLETLQIAVKDAHAGPGYLALRFGEFDVGAVGDRGLSLTGITERTPLRENGFQIVSASAQAADSIFGMRPWLDYVFAVLFMLAAAWLFLHGRNLAVKFGTTAVPGGENPSEETSASLLHAQSEPEQKVAPREPVKQPTIAIERSIFRAYDIRGIAGQTLDPSVARLIGQAIGSEMQDRGLKDIVVGRDGRESGPAMANALIEGLRTAGRDVIDIGEAPTPLTYFAAFQLRTGSCVSVTGSHNPPDHNGFKIVLGGETLSGDAIQALYVRISEDRLHKTAAPGGLQQREVAADYTSRIAEDIQVERKLKVVVDAGNGVAGMIAPEVLEAIGCEVVPLYCEVDGSFPNHHPDPSDPRNLADLIQMVQRLNADLGVAFDGDGDRLGVVTHSGEIIYPDRLLMLFAADVLERNPGACIVYDVKCTGHLAGHILRHGGSPLMWKTGHSLIKAKMKETGAELAGEMSGHFFFKERWYGFDDGIYAAARLLEILASLNESADTVFAGLPKGFSTPELKVDMPEGAAYEFVEKFRDQAKFVGARIATIDGVRADWLDGWGLVRASNTTSVL